MPKKPISALPGPAVVGASTAMAPAPAVGHRSISHPILKKKRVTKKGLLRYAEQILSAYAPHLLPQLMESLNERAQAGDVAAMRLIAELYGLSAKPSVVITNNNSLNVNNPGAGFDDIIRRMAQNDEAIDVTPGRSPS